MRTLWGFQGFGWCEWRWWVWCDGDGKSPHRMRFKFQQKRQYFFLTLFGNWKTSDFFCNLVFGQNFIVSDGDFTAVVRNVKVSMRWVNLSWSQSTSVPCTAYVESFTWCGATSGNSVVNMCTMARLNPLDVSVAQNFVTVFWNFLTVKGN